MVDSSVCPPNTDGPLPKTDVELGDIVRRFAPEYKSQYGHVMMPAQRRALSDIAACCTQELGGRLYRCDDCGHVEKQTTNHHNPTWSVGSVGHCQKCGWKRPHQYGGRTTWTCLEAAPKS